MPVRHYNQACHSVLLLGTFKPDRNGKGQTDSNAGSDEDESELNRHGACQDINC